MNIFQHTFFIRIANDPTGFVSFFRNKEKNEMEKAINDIFHQLIIQVTRLHVAEHEQYKSILERFIKNAAGIITNEDLNIEKYGELSALIDKVTGTYENVLRGRQQNVTPERTTKLPAFKIPSNWKLEKWTPSLEANEIYEDGGLSKVGQKKIKECIDDIFEEILQHPPNTTSDFSKLKKYMEYKLKKNIDYKLSEIGKKSLSIIIDQCINFKLRKNEEKFKYALLVSCNFILINEKLIKGEKFQKNLDLSIEVLLLFSENSEVAEISCKILPFALVCFYFSNKNDGFKNENNITFFSKKIEHVLMFSANNKKIIIKNIFNNFNDCMWEFILKFSKNKEDSRMQEKFGKGIKIQKVEVMADETHNKCRVPLKVRFEFASTKLGAMMYKPRSMFPELVVCGKDGLFAKINPLLSLFLGRKFVTGEVLGTYEVISEEGYGYCQFLENKIEENILEEESKIEEYMMQFFILEYFARELGLSDLHNDNIFTINCTPCITDAEVILCPTDNKSYDTHLLSAGSVAGYVPFKSNRIYFKNKNGKIVGLNLNQLSDKLKKIKEDEKFKVVLEEALQGSAIKSQIDECKRQLSTFRHRIVIIGTDFLKGVLSMEEAIAWEEFQKELEKNLLEYGFILIEGVLENVCKSFLEDLRNDDVPIFYVDGQSNL